MLSVLKQNVTKTVGSRFLRYSNRKWWDILRKRLQIHMAADFWHIHRGNAIFKRSRMLAEFIITNIENGRNTAQVALLGQFCQSECHGGAWVQRTHCRSAEILQNVHNWQISGHPGERPRESHGNSVLSYRSTTKVDCKSFSEGVSPRNC